MTFYNGWVALPQGTVTSSIHIASFEEHIFIVTGAYGVIVISWSSDLIKGTTDISAVSGSDGFGYGS